MTETVQFEALCEDLDSTQSEAGVWELLFRYVENFGMNALSYYHHSPQGAYDFDDQIFYAHGFPSQSVSQHLSSGAFLNSPFERQSTLPTTPLFWVDAKKGIEAYEKHWDELMTFYCSGKSGDDFNGLILPVHGPNNRNGCIWLRLTECNHSLDKADVRQLQWASQIAHKAFCRILDTKRKAARSLTAREREVLKWVARGKSNATIGTIVGISKHTVNGHLNHIYLKTDTSDRTMAAVRGIAEALI